MKSGGRAQPILLGAPGSAEQSSQVAVINAIALASTSMFGLVLAAIIAIGHTHPDQYRGGLLVGMVSVGLVMAEVVRRQWLPPGLVQFGYGVAALGVTIGAYAVGPTLAPAVAMLFMWFGSTVTSLSRRAAITLIAWVGLTWGVLLVVQRGHSAPFSRWQVVMVAMVTFAMAIDRMVARSWALADSERTARAASERTRGDLEVANDDKTRFLGRMSHELRTPLNAIIGFSEVLAQQTFGPLADKQAEYVDDVVDSGRHLLSLVDDLLDVAKVETGAIDLTIGPIDLAEVLSASVGLFKEDASRRYIDLRLEVASDAGVVQGDARKVRQVVFNLLSNALKFTPDHGRVSVLCRPVAGAVRISVEDTGPGVSPEDRHAIFLEFRQGDAVGAAARGTGLGLPLARRFVELHGGRLWVDSSERGATFVAELPRNAAPPQAIAVPVAPAPPASEVRVLGEADSPGRRAESARIIFILGAGAVVSALFALGSLLLLPDSRRGANVPAFGALFVVSALVVLFVRLRPLIVGAPSAVPYFAAGCTALFCVAAYVLGPEWGQFLGLFYAWAATAGMLAVGIRGSVSTFVLIGAGHALVLAGQPDATAPVARWVVTMGFVGVTTLIFRRFVLRIQALSDADQAARTEADQVAAQLIVATRHKTKFLTNMSHELRTPLNAIIGFSEVLESEAFGSLNEKQHEYVADVMTSGRHLLTLINDILDLAKVEAGRMELRMTPLDVTAAVTEAVREFEALAAARRVALQVDADDMGVINGDEAKLRDVVTKLVSNAIKFVPTGGRVHVSATRNNGHLEIAVADTGPGVAGGDHERIFEAFAHGAESAPLGQGSGLGLALARRYAELHGGSLAIESTSDQGARFVLRVPA